MVSHAAQAQIDFPAKNRYAQKKDTEENRHVFQSLSRDHQRLQQELPVLSRDHAAGKDALSGGLPPAGRKAPSVLGLSLSARHGRAASPSPAAGDPADLGGAGLSRDADNKRHPAARLSADASGRACTLQGQHQPAFVRGE